MLSADLKGKTALVTGASSGLGAHFARVLAKSGAEVFVAARRKDRLDNLVAEIASAGGKAHAVSMDVASASSVEAATASLPALDIVVNNAGLSADKGLLETSEADWRQTFDVNLDGVWRVSKLSIQKSIETGSPLSIINIASITGLRTQSGVSAYATSKAAVVHLTRSMALDAARFQVRVNAIAPGYFRTDINDDFLDTAFGEKMIKRIPQRRVGEIHELDGALLLLASSASSYMSGSIIEVDGGHLCSSL